MKKILLVLFCLFLMVGCGKKTVLLKDNLNLEINEEAKISSLISENNKIEVINKDEMIDTSKLGDKVIIIKYKDNDEERELTSKITIIDTIKPIIECKKELETTQGNKIDLLKDVKVNDNSLEEIKAIVEGEYDLNKVGTYDLKYVAVDSSNNKAEEEFRLIIKKKPTLTIGKTYVWKNNKGGQELTINKNGSVISRAWANNGGSTEYRGTYKIKDNKLTISLTKYEDVDGWRNLPKEAQKSFTNTIIDDDTFKDDKTGNVYKLK